MSQKKSSSSRRWRRSAVAAAAGLCLASVVYAQSSEGSIFGQVKPGTPVTATNVETGQTRQIQAEANGSFTFSKMAPGRYTVSAGGVSRVVNVAIGTGTQVLLEAELQRVEVVGRRTAAIDVASVESNTVFTQEQIQALPVPRNVNSVALLAPGAVQGDKNLGSNRNADSGNANLASFGGASIAENGYYINGFDVTNIRNFLSYAELPFDAIGQQQIKTGGYGAEYGRSLGGVVSLVTKRGTNEWKGGVSTYWAPEQLKASGRNVADLEPSKPGTYTVYRGSDTEGGYSVNVYGGGPIIKDKLFVFGLIEGTRLTDTDYGQDIATKTVAGRPNGMLKVDWSITDNHRLEFTGISNKKQEKVYDYTNSVPYSTSKDGEPALSTIDSGGDIMMAKYTGYLTDNLNVSALFGQVNDMVRKTTGARQDNLSCPPVIDVSGAAVGCWTPPFPGALDRTPGAPDDKDKRRAARFDLEYVLDAHTIRAGYDAQKFESSEAGTGYATGYYWRYFVSPTGTVNGVANAVAPGAEYARRRILSSTSGTYEVDNTAFYIEDSWKVNKNVVLYGGLRSESFDNKNGDGVSFVKAENLIAPRLGASWDVNGDSSLKVYANAGRYYIPVASNTNIRMTRGELFEHRFYGYGSRDPLTAAPVGLGPEIGNAQIVGDGSLPNPATVADTKLKPMSQDEFILGFQKALSKDWVVGAKAVYRKVNDGMDDFCGHGALENWAADNGYANFDSSTAAQCVLVNPGRDVNIQMDVNNDGNLQGVTIPASYFGLAQYKRTYQALELTLEKPFDGRWGMQASYVWSKSKGTAEGYVSSTINQDDAGVTQDFDFGSLTDGADGYLPNDRRHVFKLFGNYAVTDTFRVGLNSTVASGRPRSCVGFVPPSVPDYNDAVNYSTASAYYCLNDQGVTELTQRGTAGRTPWTYSLDLQFAYMPKIASGKLTLQADIFNVLNTQRVTEQDEVRDFSRSTSLTPPGQLSANYGQPTGYQTPRVVRLTARYEF
jgi:TonB-dependent Receptor Plug Domain